MTIMSQTAKYCIGYFYLYVKQWREQKSSQNHFWHSDRFALMFVHSQVNCLPTTRLKRINLSENTRVIKRTLISTILKTNMVTVNCFAFSYMKWVKECLCQVEQNCIGFQNSLKLQLRKLLDCCIPTYEVILYFRNGHKSRRVGFGCPL